MQIRSNQQAGGSPVVMVIVLAILGYGVFIGIQYAPQWLEARTVQSILDSMRDTQATDPVTSPEAARAKVIRMLQINEMDDMNDSFTVKRGSSRLTVTFSYDRTLNLGWEKRTLHYERTVHL